MLNSLRQHPNRLFLAILSITLIAFLIFPAPVWLDEAALGYNIIKGNWSNLTKPLEMGQVAPIGYLLFTKSILNVFGYSDFFIRVPSMFALIISIFLYFKTYSIHNRWIPLFGLLLFSRWFFYGFELKQYIFDILSMSYFYYYSTKHQYLTITSTLAFILLGWMSNIGLTLIPVLMISHWVFNSNRNSKDLLFVFLILVNSANYYYKFIYHHPHQSLMNQYWTEHFFPNESRHLFAWFLSHFTAFFNFNINTPIQGMRVLLGVLVTGIILYINIKNRKRWLSNFQHKVIYLIPFAFALGLAILHIYPFDGGRLTLYLSIPLTHIFNRTLINAKIFENTKIYILAILILVTSFTRLWYDKIISPRENIKPLMTTIQPTSLKAYIGSTVKHFKYYEALQAKNNENFQGVYLTDYNQITNMDLAPYNEIIIAEAFSKKLKKLGTKIQLNTREFELEKIENKKRLVLVYFKRKN